MIPRLLMEPLFGLGSTAGLTGGPPTRCPIPGYLATAAAVQATVRECPVTAIAGFSGPLSPLTEPAPLWSNARLEQRG